VKKVESDEVTKKSLKNIEYWCWFVVVK
jgi:hypothetical protein